MSDAEIYISSFAYFWHEATLNEIDLREKNVSFFFFNLWRDIASTAGISVCFFGGTSQKHSILGLFYFNKHKTKFIKANITTAISQTSSMSIKNMRKSFFVNKLTVKITCNSGITRQDNFWRHMVASIYKSVPRAWLIETLVIF